LGFPVEPPFVKNGRAFRKIGRFLVILKKKPFLLRKIICEFSLKSKKDNRSP
jgi:hypothetical protein